MGPLNQAQLAAWVADSCGRQGVPVKVTDACVVSAVAVLLSGGTARPSSEAREGGPPGLETPDEFDAARIELCDPGGSGSDHGMVEDRSDDGGLAGEVQLGPLCA